MSKNILIISASPRKNGNSGIPVENTFKTFRIFTDCLDVREKGTLAVTGVWGEGKVRGSGTMQKAFELGRKV